MLLFGLPYYNSLTGSSSSYIYRCDRDTFGCTILYQVWLVFVIIVEYFKDFEKDISVTN